MIHRRFAHIAILVAIVSVLALLGGCSLVATGTVTGTVLDSTALGVPLPGVLVTVVGTSHSATTDSSGDFTVTAPEGTDTLHLTLSGYVFYDIIVDVVAHQTTAASNNIIAYHPLGAGQYRMVLTWGASPSDLDSHLILPSGPEEIMYTHKTANDGSANLDWDVTDSYGPETITITTLHTAGVYSYFAYNFSQSPNMGANSDAVVNVYDSTGLIKTLKITDAPGSSSSSALYWDVLSINNGSFQYNNVMSATKP